MKKEVTNIDWNTNSKSAVKCSDGSIVHADHVVVTTSLGVLKQSHEQLFTPKLPKENKCAIDEISFGAVGKIFLEFDEKFWEDDWVGFSLLWSDEDLKDIEGTENAW
jgi:spermine oxidase